MTRETEYTFAGFQFPRQIPQLLRTGHGERRKASKYDTRYKVSTSYSVCPSRLGQDKNVSEMSFYFESEFQPGLRWQWCDEIAKNIRHTGWYTDEDGIGDTIRGVVFRLPHGRGFVPGWTYGKGMLGAVARDVYDGDDELGAAHEADRLAQRTAENERDHNAKWDAAQRWRDLGAELKHEREQRGKAMKALRQHRQGKPLDPNSIKPAEDAESLKKYGEDWTCWNNWQFTFNQLKRCVQETYENAERLHEERNELESQYGQNIGEYVE